MKKQLLFKWILTGFLTIALLTAGGCAGKSNDTEQAQTDVDTDTESSDTETEDMSFVDTTRLDEGWEKVEEEQPPAADMAADAGEVPEETDNTQETHPDAETDPQENTAAGGAEETAEDTGRLLSILGDSISTFVEWIPEGYSDFFPMSGEVTEVGQTWWKMVLDDTGMRLCVNGSSSGSTCAGDSQGADDPKNGCSDFRINALAGEAGEPDIIIVYMGTNDLIRNVPLGDNDGSRAVAEGVIENFSDAYTLILDKLRARYPQARIYCCTLVTVCGVDENMKYVEIANERGFKASDYSRQIRTIAAAKGCTVIDLEYCGINAENAAQYVSDGVHLKPEGMKLIRDAVETVITDL
ncbi:MAG: GDSL-type esterase/lipase family protein [Roseburia sp.]|nr:GDSL-type esterase/lipase family protein [Roseburia sp.]MCM1242105.1 GDSL-type esterase/lipase family protein [Roseburia sp.]